MGDHQCRLPSIVQSYFPFETFICRVEAFLRGNNIPLVTCFDGASLLYKYNGTSRLFVDLYQEDAGARPGCNGLDAPTHDGRPNVRAFPRRMDCELA